MVRIHSEWETAIALDRNNTSALRQLGVTLMHLGRPEEAIPIIEKGIRLSPYDAGTPGTYQVLGLCHLLLGHVETAIELFRKSLAGNTRLYYTHMSLAAALGLKDDLVEARLALAEALSLRPDIQCEMIKIDGLKLYPPGPDARGWVLDDEKNTYPLFDVLRRHGVKNVCVHKGLPGLFLEQYCHTDDLVRAAAAFPDLNFIAFHSAFPWEAELAGQAKAAKVKNLYAELGSLARMMRTDPARYSVLIGNLLDGFGADHIIWGTDTPVIGPPHWQIEAFQTFTIPEQLAAQYHFSRLTPGVKNKIFGENAARIFGIDIAAARQAIEGDLLYKLRDDRNPLPSGAAPL
jgi:Amidohydrolase/Tetratricopeptide repeat